MRIWIVCWANRNGTPDMDVFTDVETAMSCLRFMAENGTAAIIKTIKVEQKAEGGDPSTSPDGSAQDDTEEQEEGETER